MAIDSVFIIGIIVRPWLLVLLRKAEFRIYTVVSWLNPNSKYKGVWQAAFKYKTETIQEEIELYTLFDKKVLGVVTSGRWKGSRRVEGKIDNNGRITGTWQHPDPVNNHVGTFVVTLDENGREMNGHWAGQNPKEPENEHDAWIWKKITTP